MDRADIAFAVGSPGVEISRVTIHPDAENRYKGTKLTLSTALIAATAVVKNVPVSTFDQDSRKFGDVRVEPNSRKRIATPARDRKRTITVRHSIRNLPAKRENLQGNLQKH